MAQSVGADWFRGQLYMMLTAVQNCVAVSRTVCPQPAADACSRATATPLPRQPLEAPADELGCSERTVKRDLDALRDQIEFEGAPKTGHYRLKQPR